MHDLTFTDDFAPHMIELPKFRFGPRGHRRPDRPTRPGELASLTPRGVGDREYGQPSRTRPHRSRGPSGRRELLTIEFGYARRNQEIARRARELARRAEELARKAEKLVQSEQEWANRQRAND